MAYVMQLLPDEMELDVIKLALREFAISAETSPANVDIAWGILATIHKAESDNRARESAKNARQNPLI